MEVPNPFDRQVCLLDQIRAMKPSLKDSVGRVRIVGMIEGVSFLLLLGVAMPLRTFMGMDMAVTVAGWIHGGLFILLMLLAFIAWLKEELTMGQGFLVFIAALLPFGPFVLDRYLAKNEQGG